MSEIPVTDTVEIHDNVTIKTTASYTDTVNILDSITIKTTAPYSDTVSILDSVSIKTAAPYSDTLNILDNVTIRTAASYSDILGIHYTVTIERVRDGEVVESRVITYPERVTVMNLDLLLDALALTLKELGVKAGENVRDIGMIFLAGTFGVETIKMTKDIKLMLSRMLEDMIRAMKG